MVLSVWPAVSTIGAEIPVSALAFESIPPSVPWVARVKLSPTGLMNLTS